MQYYITRAMVVVGFLFAIAAAVMGFTAIWITDPDMTENLNNSASLSIAIGLVMAGIGAVVADETEKPVKNKENAA